MMTVKDALEVMDVCDFSTAQEAGKKIGELVRKDIMSIKEASFILACLVIAIEYLKQTDEQ